MAPDVHLVGLGGQQAVGEGWNKVPEQTPSKGQQQQHPVVVVTAVAGPGVGRRIRRRLGRRRRRLTSVCRRRPRLVSNV